MRRRFEKEARALRYYDINSSYPTAMLSTMPADEASVWEGEPPERFKRSRIGFVEADVKIMLNATYGKFGMRTLRKKLYLY